MRHPPSAGRRGYRWRKLRAQVLTEETTCWLCGDPVDKTLPGTHPRGGVADHVLPLSKGGPPMDRANLRLAHNQCNARRGDRPPTPLRPPLRTSRRW